MVSKIAERQEAYKKLALDSHSFYLDSVMESAKKAYLDGDSGFASALLAKGSQYAEDNDLIDISVSMLVIAERLLDE